MRASKKADLLANERFDAAEAVSVLDRETARLAQVEAVVRAGFAPEPVQDFSPYYFGGPSPSCDDLQQPDGARDVCGGRCIGMVGSAIVFEQGGASFVVCLKDWESHEVELVENEGCAPTISLPSRCRCCRGAGPRPRWVVAARRSSMLSCSVILAAGLISYCFYHSTA